MLKDFSLASITAGFVAVLTDTTGSIAIIFQAAQSAGTTEEQISSKFVPQTGESFVLDYQLNPIILWIAPKPNLITFKNSYQRTLVMGICAKSFW